MSKSRQTHSSGSSISSSSSSDDSDHDQTDPPKPNISSSTIKIYARIRPPRAQKAARTREYYINTQDTLPIIGFKIPKDEAQGLINNQKETHEFKFERIFDVETQQAEVFDVVAKDVCDSVLDGYNGTIFAYGQTGSGKTFTITGGAERYSDRGLIPRCIQYLFGQVVAEERKSGDYEFKISYLEIYNEVGYDLLDTSRDAKKLEDLTRVTIQEDQNDTIHLKNLSLTPALTEEEAINLLFVGDTNKMIAETPSNPTSSRSHCIFIITITSRHDDTLRRSKLHLVDLAGSERVHRTHIEGTLLKEARFINLSLHYLEQVIVALQQQSIGKRSHIPYRNSMMTSVLRDSIGGNCKTTMIATAAVEDPLIEESISTCRFAQRVALISNKAEVNEEVDPALVIARLRREIVKLKAQLAIARGDTASTDILAEYEIERVKAAVDEYVADTALDSMLVFADFGRIACAFKILKEYVLRKGAGTLTTTTPDTAQRPKLGFDEKEYLDQIDKFKGLVTHRDNEINILVSMINKLKATGSPRIPGRESVPPAAPATLSSSLTPPTDPPATKSTLISAEKARAFDIFKQAYPAGDWIHGQKNLLKQKYADAKILGESANALRNQIKHLKSQISTDAQNADSDSGHLKQTLTRTAQMYKESYQTLKDMKIEIEHLHHLLDQARHRLTRDFEHWFDTVYMPTTPAKSVLLLDDTPPVGRSTSSMDLDRRDSGRELGGFDVCSVDKAVLSPSNAGLRAVMGTASFGDAGQSTGVSGKGSAYVGRSSVSDDIEAFYRARDELMKRR